MVSNQELRKLATHGILNGETNTIKKTPELACQILLREDIMNRIWTTSIYPSRFSLLNPFRIYRLNPK
jgi:hypothetical protein